MAARNTQSPAKPRALHPTIHPLRPIISPTSSLVSPTSPNMSRRSSSSSSASGKCVHFPCNPAQMSKSFYTFSREHYDRSPIIPSGEDLDIPSCKSEEGSWIKCLERKAREAAQEGHAPPHTSLRALDPTVDVDRRMISPGSETPSLTDEYSSCSESDDPSNISATSSSPMYSSTYAHCRTASLEMFMRMAVPDETTTDWASQADADMCSDDESAQPEPSPSIRYASEPSQPRKLGMCALGKFTKQSLYENDAFGGCALLLRA